MILANTLILCGHETMLEIKDGVLYLNGFRVGDDPDFALSRYLTNTTSESFEGIFSNAPGTYEFYRPGLRVEVYFSEHLDSSLLDEKWLSTIVARIHDVNDAFNNAKASRTYECKVTHKLNLKVHEGDFYINGTKIDFRAISKIALSRRLTSTDDEHNLGVFSCDAGFYTFSRAGVHRRVRFDRALNNDKIDVPWLIELEARIKKVTNF